MFVVIKRRVLDLVLQELRSMARNRCSPWSMGIEQNGQCLAPYFLPLSDPDLRSAYTPARFNVLPSALLYGRFNKTPYAMRVCPCGLQKLESLARSYIARFT